ncbi:hypothetical protein N431DRAFT_39338 [Stipitochalara longipes BDJ]|nr:hypothetical protein N431DRAFT_39338 [Stipitochalara longipes BDJ]
MGLQASEDEHRKAIPTSTVNEGSPLSPRSHSRGSEERVTKIPDETTPEKTIPVKTPAVKTSAVKKPPMQTATEKKSTRRSNN